MVTSKQVEPVLRLTPVFVDKVKSLCNSINTVEWSGILLYNVVDETNFIFEAIDFIPMAKGNSGYTTFAFSGVATKYIMDQDYDLMTIRMGLIHSHHNMATFFSHEDDDELKVNAPNHTYYMSLIVNNRQEYCCALAHMVKAKGVQREVICKDIWGNDTVQHIAYMEEDFIIKYPTNVVVPSTSIADPIWEACKQAVVAQQVLVPTQPTLFGATAAPGKSKSSASFQYPTTQWIIESALGLSGTLKYATTAYLLPSDDLEDVVDTIVRYYEEDYKTVLTYNQSKMLCSHIALILGNAKSQNTEIANLIVALKNYGA